MTSLGIGPVNSQTTSPVTNPPMNALSADRLMPSLGNDWVLISPTVNPPPNPKTSPRPSPKNGPKTSADSSPMSPKNSPRPSPKNGPNSSPLNNLLINLYRAVDHDHRSLSTGFISL